MREASSADDPRHSDLPKSRNLRQLAKLWPLLRPYKGMVAGALVALSMASILVLFVGYGLRYLVDAGFSTGNIAVLNKAVVIMLIIVLLLALAVYFRVFTVTWLGERVVADLRRRVFDHVVTLSPAFFEITKTGEVLSRVTTDTTLLQVVVGTTLPIALRNTMLFLGGSVALFLTSPKLAGLVFLVIPLVVPPVIIIGRRVRALSRNAQDRIADVGASLNETLYGIRIVQAFNHQGHDKEAFAERTEEAFSAAVSRTRARALLGGTVMGLVFGAIAVILWIGGQDVVQGRITSGELAAFVLYAVIVASSLGSLSELIGDLQRAAGATERLRELLDTKPDILPPADPKPLPDPAQGRVSFRQVTFHYPSRPDEAALHDFTLEVAPGERIALVGPSGAGKSTVLQLLLRFYDPTEGSVALDGVDLREADPAALRARQGLVPQEATIFSATLADNIRYGRPDASDAAVKAAADAAYATEFIETLPEGFDTYVGERGIRLSGGQRQRVAIARALLRDPAVLLLDEATSALDAESERFVQQALDHLMAGRTTIMIAHRLATVKKADRLIVMDKGRVVDSGTHEELVEKGGLYARLAELQFQNGNGG
ncbi:MAG: ABC transporter transmembrane domain-containing protein [Limibacillus sp.]|jgi:ATP-binding cassette subfamily B protein